jgi:protein-S-isoprenylcysteine O-methyltransferase Ste14
MPRYAYAILAAGWIVWLMPFLLARRKSEPAKQVDRRARWGIVLVAISYSILWQCRFWERPVPLWRLVFSVLFMMLACLLSWTSTRFLGRQWRVDAGLSSDHELVMSGPYRFMRHPIYTSMLCMLLGAGFMITPWPLFLVAMVVFVVGTEIRVRVEDNLLASRFGDRFLAYQRSVPAYIPFLKKSQNQV